MEIEFHLGWFQTGRSAAKAFKQISAYELFSEYVRRISKFMPCRVMGTIREEVGEKGAKLWVCDSGRDAVSLTSENLAARFEKLLDLIGGPDGFSEADIKRLRPDLKLSFGPLTLPHELAAVVAGEQIYRALTIIHKMPYHLGH